MDSEQRTCCSSIRTKFLSAVGEEEEEEKKTRGEVARGEELAGCGICILF